MSRKHPIAKAGIGRTLLSAGVVLAGLSTVAVTSLALFTDSASVGANTLTAGTVDINANPAVAVVAMPAMGPGDQVTGPLTVSNDGSLDLRYTGISTTTEDVLASELVLTVKSGVTTCDDAGWAADGTTLYSGRLGSTGSDTLFGSVVPGADAGDRVLAATASEVLCLNVTLPYAATAGQGVTTTATLLFDAEQTVNNP